MIICCKLFWHQFQPYVLCWWIWQLSKYLRLFLTKWIFTQPWRHLLKPGLQPTHKQLSIQRDRYAFIAAELLRFLRPVNNISGSKEKNMANAEQKIINREKDSSDMSATQASHSWRCKCSTVFCLDLHLILTQTWVDALCCSQQFFSHVMMSALNSTMQWRSNVYISSDAL